MSTSNHLLVVAHGSRREASNDEVRQLCTKLSELNSHYASISSGFLELAEPSIPDGLRQLIATGAKEITVMPYFLSAGRHVSEDIPEEIETVRQEYPEVSIKLAPYFGAAKGVPQLIIKNLI